MNARFAKLYVQLRAVPVLGDAVRVVAPAIRRVVDRPRQQTPEQLQMEAILDAIATMRVKVDQLERRLGAIENKTPES
jgi:ubiquinone biosynthesis protein UbiJ